MIFYLSRGEKLTHPTALFPWLFAYRIDVRMDLSELLHMGHLFLLEKLQFPPILGQALILGLVSVHIVTQPQSNLLQGYRFTPKQRT